MLWIDDMVESLRKNTVDRVVHLSLRHHCVSWWLNEIGGGWHRRHLPIARRNMLILISCHRRLKWWLLYHSIRLLHHTIMIRHYQLLRTVTVRNYLLRTLRHIKWMDILRCLMDHYLLWHLLNFRFCRWLPLWYFRWPLICTCILFWLFWDRWLFNLMIPGKVWRSSFVSHLILS